MLYKIAMFIYCILWIIEIHFKSFFDNTLEQMYNTDNQLDELEKLIDETF